MSIAKNTQTRKKVVAQNAKLTPKGKKTEKTRPRLQAEFDEKYPNMGAIHESEIRQLIFTVPLAQLPVYGARFQAAVQALEAARHQPSPKTKQAVVRLIADLEKESSNQRYRQVLRAMAAAGQSESGLNRAYWTALRVMEMTFEWSFEYMFAFGLYEQRLKSSRQADQITQPRSEPRRRRA